MRKKIVLDVDGVLLNFIDAFEEVAHTLKDDFGKELQINKNLYHLNHRLGITLEQENRVWQKFEELNMWEKLNPLPGVIQAIESINKAGFDIYIVTAIEEKYMESRLKNLREIGVIPKEIYCVGYNNSKKEIVDRIKPDVFVDDRLDHLHNASSPFQLVWLQDEVEQHNIQEDKGVDYVVSSLKEWTDNYMHELVEKLEESMETKIPLQRSLRFC